MKNIATAVCKVMAAASHVQKTGKNSFHGYNYASDADLLRVLQPAMADAGLIMVPTQVAQSDKQLDKGKMQTDVHVQYTLVHSSGETMTVQAVGRGIDKEDKGPYKAMTGALKYALRQTFLVPTGDDPESHSAVHNAPPRAPSTAPAPSRSPEKRARPVAPPAPASVGTPACPKCGGDMHDFSEERRKGGNKPAYKCKDGRWNHKTKTTDGCDGIIWNVVESGGAPKNEKVSDIVEGFDDDIIPF